MQGIPNDWDQNEINARFSLVGSLQSVHFVKNSAGSKTGKVVIEYTEKDSADQAVARFDNQAIEGQVCKVKPFINNENMGDDSSRKNASMLARRVYLMNIPYSATSAELERLCSEFAPVDQVVIPRDKAGLSRGFAFVYLENAGDVKTVIEYVDGRHVQGRQVRAKVSLVDNDGKKKR